MSEKYISLPIDQGRIETTPVNNGDQIDLHVANANLLDLAAARALVREREADLAYERETRPLTGRDLVEMTGDDLGRIKDAHARESTGEIINVVQLRPRPSVTQQDYRLAS